MTPGLQQKILGIDHGTARIGVAVSDELGMLAHPRETIDVARTKDPLARVAEIARAENVARIIVGHPRNMDGSTGASAERVRAFVKGLETIVACPVQLWDERLSTMAAQRTLHEAGRTVKSGKNVLDQVAAQHILQGYLDSLITPVPWELQE